jgi:hypothetical protein
VFDPRPSFPELRGGGGVDCVRGVTLNGKVQTFSRLAEVVFDQAA